MPDYIILGVSIAALFCTVGCIGVIVDNGWKGGLIAAVVVALVVCIFSWERAANNEQKNLATVSYLPIISVEGIKGFKFNDKFHQFQNDARFADIATTQVQVKYAKEGWYLGVRVTGDHFKYSLVPKTEH